jgi:hypothetical protein
MRLELAGYAILSSLALAACVGLTLNPIDTSALKPSEQNWRLPLSQPTPSSSRVESSGRLSTILARPLFSESRRPFEPVAQNPPAESPGAKLVTQSIAPETPPVEAEILLLKGVLLHSGTARALIASGSYPVGVWIMQGESIDGWVVARVTKESVRLTRGKSEAQLELYQPMNSVGLIRQAQPFSEVSIEYKRK